MIDMTLKRVDSDNNDFRHLIAELDSELRVRNGDLMDTYDQYNLVEQVDTVVVAFLNNEPTGCACFKRFDNENAEVKRMFVRKHARGNGISSAILIELEKWALEKGFKCTILETGSRQTEALSLYSKAGYQVIPNYGPYRLLRGSICFRKQLSNKRLIN